MTTIRLKHPIEVSKGPPIDELKFGKIRSGLLRPFIAEADYQFTHGDYIDMIAELTSQPKSVIERLELDDYFEARRVFGELFHESMALIAGSPTS